MLDSIADSGRAGRAGALTATFVAVAALLGVVAFLPGTSVAAPDGRVWEQVSPVDKNGADAIELTTNQPQFAGADGDSMLYGTSGAFADAPTSGAVFYRSVRGSAGWSTRAISPALPAGAVPGPGVHPLFSATSDDTSRTLLRQQSSPGFIEGAPEGNLMAVYGRDLVAGTFDWLSRPTLLDPFQPVGSSVGPVGASKDLRHVVIEAKTGDPATSTVRLVPEDSSRTTGRGLYETVDGGPLRPVGVLPDGTIHPGGASSPSSYVTRLTAASYRNQVSEDGSHIVFLSPDPWLAVPQIYVRIDGSSTKLVSRSELTGLPNTTFVAMDYASPDGSKIWFTAWDEQLTSDAPPATAFTRYRFDVDTEDLTYEPEGVPLVSSADGSRYLFTQPDSDELWFSGDGVTRRVADPVVFPGLGGEQQLRVSDDGRRFAFVTDSALVADDGRTFNNGDGFSQLYVYDAAADQLSCVSCPPDGVVATGDVGLGHEAAYIERWQAARLMTGDGQTLFFDTPTAFVAADNNAVRDVYAWSNGHLSLLSKGSGGRDSVYLDNGESGRDVFFATADRLVPTDVDGNHDVYDARLGGGFPAIDGPAPCAQDCQGPLAAVPFMPVPASSRLVGDGNLDLPGATYRVGKVSPRARARFARTGNLSVVVRTTGAGTVSARAGARLGTRWIRSAKRSRTLSRAGVARIPVELSPRAMRYLARHGGMRVRVEVFYSEADGARRASFVLKRPSREQARKRPSRRSSTTRSNGNA